jgi:ligand-binding SRPBCC domain-containing protein
MLAFRRKPLLEPARLLNWVVTSQRSFMPVIELETRIAAPINVVFDLSRSIDLHIKSTAQTNERAVAGCTSGLIGLDEDVTWEATHFGVRQELTTTITQYDRPRHFRDSMVRGAFRRFDHDHVFETEGAGTTLMKDVFDYSSPFGVLGHVADALFLKRYMTRLLRTRNALVKSVAESGEADLFVKGRITPVD